VQAQWREPSLYRSKFAPYLAQHPEAWAARTLWQGDHAQLDLMVAHPTTGKPVRPWLTAWLDWRTRRITGWCLSLNPDSSTILAALRHGLLHQREANMGGPDAVWIDNGKDYDSYTFKGQTKAERQQVQKQVEQFRFDKTKTEGIFNLLGIEPHFSIPHNPNGKSRIERWFGTLHEQFDKSFRTYCGSNHADRPESLESILKKSGQLPSFEHVRQRLAEFIAGYNASADHQREDMLGWSPDAAIQAWAPNRRAYASTEALDHCLQVWHQPKTVGKNGVTIQVGGASIGYGYTDAALRPYKGRRDAKVRIAYDPWDLSSVRVYDESWRFITEAKANPTGGGQSAVTKQQVAKAQRERSRYRTKRKEVAQNAHHEYLSTFEIAGQESASQANQSANDTPLKIVQTPLDQASQDHQRQQQADARVEAREPINLADFQEEDDPVEGLCQLWRNRHDGEDDEELGPIDLSQYPIDGQAGENDEDDGHLLDELGQEGGAA
jgi:putative transposase